MKDYYNEIKEQIVSNEIIKRVKDYSKNRSDLNTYYNVGKLLSGAGKHYGDGIIKEYSQILALEIEKGVAKPHHWSHIISLLPLEDKNEIKYYINISIERCL